MNSPYNQYHKYLKAKYNERVQKITVLGGFSCPNRDGSIGLGGCTFCNNQSFAPPQHLLDLSITDQINHGIKASKKRYKANKYIIYFQSYSNTYSDLINLKRKYEEALSHPQVVGLSIGTRPDCIDEYKIDYLAELSEDYDISIEYGLESIDNAVLDQVNRCHTYEDFINAVNMSNRKKIQTGCHIIFGLPDEKDGYHIKTAEQISRLPLTFVKIHQLHILNDTLLGSEYISNPFPLLDLNHYIDLLMQFLANLDKKIIIQRLFSESPKELLIGPHWNISMSEFLLQLEKRMTEFNIFQGSNTKIE